MSFCFVSALPTVPLSEKKGSAGKSSRNLNLKSAEKTQRALLRWLVREKKPKSVNKTKIPNKIKLTSPEFRRGKFP